MLYFQIQFPREGTPSNELDSSATKDLARRDAELKGLKASLDYRDKNIKAEEERLNKLQAELSQREADLNARQQRLEADRNFLYTNPNVAR